MRYILFFTLLFPLILSAQLSEKDNELLRNELSSKINQLRNSLGLKSLIFNDTLRKAAEFHSEYMVKNNVLTHDQKQSKYQTPAKRVYAVGGEVFELIGENVLYSRPQKFPATKKSIVILADEMFNSWKNSPGHYANMINPEYAYGDLGFSVADNQTVYATHVFGRKGYVVQGQISSNAFGLKKAEDDCDKTYERYRNIVMNMGNGLSIEDNEVILRYHDIHLLSEILSQPNDGFAIDFVSKEQVTCGKENQLDVSRVYDGILFKPVYRQELFSGNRAEGNYRIITKVGDIPSGLDSGDYSPSLIFIKDGKACNYVYPAEVYSKKYELRDFKPIVKDEPAIPFLKEGIIASQQIEYEFKTNQIAPVKLPVIERSENIHSVILHSYSSVEGDSVNNKRLHHARAEAIKRHVQSKAGIPDELFSSQSEENWDLMRFQLNYFKQDNLASLSIDSLKKIIRNRSYDLPWDSLLYEQRRSIAVINYSGSFAEDFETIGEFNLRTAVTTGNTDLANKSLYAMYMDQEYYPPVLFEPQVMEFFKKNPEAVANYTALLADEFYSDPYQTVVFMNHWLNKPNVLSIDARANLLHLYTLMGEYFLDNWDVSSERLSHVVHPVKIEKFNSEKMPNELVLNLHLVFINYFGQINDSPGISRSFYFISDYFKSKTLKPEDDVALALFFNKWSMYRMAVEYLIPKFKRNQLNEDGVFILGTNMNLSQIENTSELYLDVHKKAASMDRKRWCEWLERDFQIKRNVSIKQLYCDVCN